MSDRERLAEALEQAVVDLNNRGVISDGCGWEEIADALLTSDALAQMLAEARAEALREVREAEKEIHARGQRADREWCEHRDMYQAGRMEAYYDAVYVLRATLAVAEPDAGEGCDCTELCSMGPTCPGGMFAGLPGAGCWRSDRAEPDAGGE